MILLAGVGLVGIVAQLIEGTAYLGIDALREVEVGEQPVEDRHDFVDAQQITVVVIRSRHEGLRDHPLYAADTLETAVFADDSLIVGIIKPVAPTL